MRILWGYQGNIKTIVTSRQAFSNSSVDLKPSGEDELGPQSSQGLSNTIQYNLDSDR